MTTTPNEPAAATPPLVAPSVPVPVIGYAGIGTNDVISTQVKLLLGFAAALHLMIGVPLILWPLEPLFRVVLQSGNIVSDSLGFVAIGFAAGAPNVWCGIVMLRKRRPMTWRAIHAVLAVLGCLELLVVIGGAALIIAHKYATGWDGLVIVAGMFLIIAASVPFWLHALTKLLLLRRDVRRAFRLGADEPTRVQRIGTVTMISLYGTAALLGGIIYLVT